jgi:phosphohistidine phosphatase SixA
MRLTIVRHAYAGDKRRWRGDDLQRPLPPVGLAQAEGLAPLLLAHRVRRVLSSPALRCVQTVEPTAGRADVEIETWDELGPQGPGSWIVTTCFGDPAFDDAVLCTHGEVLQPLLQLEDVRREARRQRLSRRQLLTKGAAWRLHITDGARVTRLVQIVPPLA